MKTRGAGSGNTARACTAMAPRVASRRRAPRPSAASNKLPAGEDAEDAPVEQRAVLGRPGQPGNRFLQAGAARAGQRQRRLVLMRVEHDLVPELGGKRAAGD